MDGKRLSELVGSLQIEELAQLRGMVSDRLAELVRSLRLEELVLLRDLANSRLANEGKRCARCHAQMGYDDQNSVCVACVRAIYESIFGPLD